MGALTVKELLACKGQRKLTQVNVHKASEAAACEAAGIDMIITWERTRDHPRTPLKHRRQTRHRARSQPRRLWPRD